MKGRGRRSAVAAAVAVVVMSTVALAACSDDGEAASSRSSGERRTTTTLLDDEAFDEAIAGFTRDVEDAGDDFCAVVEAATVELETAAANPAQVERTIGFQVKVMESLAGTEPRDEEHAAVLLRTRQALLDAAEAAEFSPEFLESEEFAEIMMSEDFQTALNSYYQRAQQDCGLAPEPSTGG